jgi:hypothetical protein
VLSDDAAAILLLGRENVVKERSTGLGQMAPASEQFRLDGSAGEGC